MSDTEQILLFFCLFWGVTAAAWFWIRWRLLKDIEAERQAREAWAAVVPREGCTRNIPGCICARENLGEQCMWRRTAPSGATGE